MRKYAPLFLVALVSSVFTLLLGRWILPPRYVNWPSRDNGEAQLTGMVDKLFSARSGSVFRSSAPTHFTTSAEVATPAVVNIRALQETDGGLWSGGSLTGSSGSGVIMSPDGFIVTNHHVVENSTDIKVTLADRREYKAKMIGSDPSTDIALLKIAETALPFVVFGDSDSVKVGEWVLAVGNPFNLSSTVTAGIISAKGRNINILGGGTSIESFLQTDAAVNPGNSGGALVNSAGELIGINTAIITESGSYEGYSFAVPSNLVQKVVRDLREFGTMQRAFLGVGIEDLDSEIARDIGLPDPQGVYVTRINANGAAEDAGLQIGDVIIGMNDTRIRSTPELQEYIGRYRPGENVVLEYWRKGSKYRSKVTLKDNRNSTNLARYRGNELEESIGFELRELSREEQRRLGMQGTMVVSIRKGSTIHLTNMQPGFIISSVNGNRINSMGEAIEAIKNAYNNIVLDGNYEGEPDLYSYRFKKRSG
jgi:serine protease Do